MTHILEVFDLSGDDSTTKSYKTMAGAVSGGMRELKKLHKRTFYGYIAADRRIGGEGWQGKHVVAEWRDGTKVLAMVWI